MGVDICMYVLPTEVLTDEQRRRISGDLASKVGREFFWITRPSDDEFSPPEGRHALEFTTDEFDAERCGFQVAPEGLLEVSTFGRYYGPGYERGDWQAIKTTAEVLEVLLPGCKIWYCGDSTDTADLFDAAFRATIHQHFLEHGHQPYRGYRAPWRDEKIEKCAFCGQREMNNTGGGGDRSFWSCDGCGQQLIVKNDGDRLVLKSGQDFFEASRLLP